MPRLRAQANFSSGVKQQQWRQHSSALRQPQAWSWHGNGWLRSLSGPSGSGTPEAAATYETSTTPAQSRRPRETQELFRRGGMTVTISRPHGAAHARST
jgi:hypothetical protein